MFLVFIVSTFSALTDKKTGACGKELSLINPPLITMQIKSSERFFYFKQHCILRLYELFSPDLNTAVDNTGQSVCVANKLTCFNRQLLYRCRLSQYIRYCRCKQLYLATQSSFCFKRNYTTTKLIMFLCKIFSVMRQVSQRVIYNHGKYVTCCVEIIFTLFQRLLLKHCNNSTKDSNIFFLSLPTNPTP